MTDHEFAVWVSVPDEHVTVYAEDRDEAAEKAVDKVHMGEHVATMEDFGPVEEDND